MKLTPSRSACALLVLAVAAAYANALPAAFQFDDWNVIVFERRVHGLAAWWGAMPGIRPLLKLSYVLSWNLSPQPFAFHLANVGIHAANACLVYTLLARHAAKTVALTTALIFALHPVQTEAVTYVSGRSVSLSALFALGFLATTGWLSAALLAGGLLVRETVAVAVVAKRGLASFFVLAGAAVLALASPWYLHLFGTSVATRPLGTQLLTQAHAVVYLIGQLVRFDRLNADPNLPIVTAWSVRTALEAGTIVALVATGVALWRKRPPIAYAILWFFLWLLPTNSILPRLDVANDRQLYIAMLGPAFLLAHALGALAKRRGNAFPWGLTIVLAIVLATATHVRNRVYRDEVSFWDDVAAKSPDNVRAFNNLGYVLALEGRNDEAEAALRRALALAPEDVTAFVNLRLLHDGLITKANRRR